MNHINTHLLLDAARVGVAMKTGKELNCNYSSLYKGRSKEELAEFAPYIFSVSKEGQFSQWFIQNGWSNSWGIFLLSSVSAKDVYQHLRKFLIVCDERGRDMYFRFYDPRVLRIFLPTCDMKQLLEFFGPIHSFFVEDEDPAFGLQFWLKNGQLKTSRVIKADIEQLIS